MLSSFNDIYSLICGLHCTFIIDSYGSIHSFGNNYCGKLGQNNDSENVSIPKKIESLPQIKILACGEHHTCCVDYDGNLFTFGSNTYGQLGVNKTKDALIKSEIPLKVSLDEHIDKISCGRYFTICIDINGNLWSFGRNDYQQLGFPHNENCILPLKIPSLNNIEFIECGGYHAFCKDIDDVFYSWGYGTHAQLGNGKTKYYNQIEKCIKWPDNIVSLSTGIYHTFLLTDEGKIYSFGYNNNGQTGLGNMKQVISPKLIENIPVIKRIQCSYFQSMCIDLDDNLWICGYNSYSQLGLSDSTDRFNLVKHNLQEQILDVSKGGEHFFIKTQNNEIYAFGRNNNHQLGLEDGDRCATPIRVFQDNEDIWSTKLGKSRAKSARK